MNGTMKILAREITQTCGGRIIRGDPEREVTFVTTGSRKVGPGAPFVPIIGEWMNAHRFLPEAAEAGAATVLTRQPEERHPESACAWIATEDTRAVLQQVAGARHFHFPIPVAGVTGSAGETTTKEIFTLALSVEHNVMKIEGSFNSQLGVPFTVFRLLPEYEAVVIEMGMSKFGEVAHLAQATGLTCAVITNIGISHIENLETRENIHAEELHVTDVSTGGSVLFLSGDDPLLAQLRGTLPFHIVFFGTQPQCDVRVEKIVSFGGTTGFTAMLQEFHISMALPVPGEHNVFNALASLAVTQYLGIPPQKVAGQLQTYSPSTMRQQIHQAGGITVADDSHNMSPDSIHNSVNILMDLKGTGRAISVLANTLELGDYSRQAHSGTDVYTVSHGVGTLFVIGKQAQEIRWGTLSMECHLPVFSYLSNEQALKRLLEYLQPGDTVIVRSSHGMKTDEIVRGLLVNGGETTPAMTVRRQKIIGNFDGNEELPGLMIKRGRSTAAWQILLLFS